MRDILAPFGSGTWCVDKREWLASFWCSDFDFFFQFYLWQSDFFHPVDWWSRIECLRCSMGDYCIQRFKNALDDAPSTVTIFLCYQWVTLAFLKGLCDEGVCNSSFFVQSSQCILQAQVYDKLSKEDVKKGIEYDIIFRGRFMARYPFCTNYCIH